MKAGDTLPALAAVLSRADGPVNLTGATVTFVMRDPTALTPKVERPAAIANAEDGQVVYFWQPADTDTPGIYDGSWIVTAADGSRQTYPTDDYLEINIELDLSKTGVALRTVRPTDGVRPSVSEVGSLLANRGKNRQDIQFGFDSKPSYAQVQSIIGQIASELDAELGSVAVTPALASLARWCISLGAASTVELTFFPEQASSGGDTSGIWWSRYQLALSRFRGLLEQSGGGPAQFASAQVTSPTLAAARTYAAQLLVAGLQTDDIWVRPPELWP